QGDSVNLVNKVVRPWPSGLPPYLGVTLMKRVIHRQDSYPNNVGHWRCSIALEVLLGRVSAWLLIRNQLTPSVNPDHTSANMRADRRLGPGLGSVSNDR